MKIIKNKIFRLLAFIFVLGVLLGMISYFLINENDISIIKNNLLSYINSIKLGSFDYSSSIVSSIINNLKYITIIWITGIIFIISFIIPFIVFFKGIIIGFALFNIIGAFGIKGILYSLIIAFPSGIIYLMILFIISYYSIMFAIKTYKSVKFNKCINIKDFVKNYTSIYLLLSFVSILNSFIDVYFVSNILKFVV